MDDQLLPVTDYTIPTCYDDKELEENLKNIEKTIDDLNKRRDAGLDPLLNEKLKKQLLISQVYHSNAIEGNILSLRETELILEGMVINERPLKDELEARSLANATDYLYKLIDGREPLTKRTLLELHGLIMKNIPDQKGGQFRIENVSIKNSKHVPPEFLHVDGLIDKMFQWMNRYSHKYTPLKMASILHHWLTWIHPFSDGNGRVSRLFLNFFLLQKGYPEIVIKISDRDEYYNSLISADNGNITNLVNLIAEKIRQTVNIYEEFINENERQKAWKEKYRDISDVQYQKAKETYSFQYEVWKNQVSVFKALLLENISDISGFLPHLRFSLKEYEILSFSQYLDILEDRPISNTWYINLSIYDTEKSYGTSFIFYFDRFKYSKPISIMNEPTEQNLSKNTARWVSKPQIKLYVSARRNHQSYSLNKDIDLVNVGTWGDQLSFGIVNRNWRPGYRKYGAKIVTIKENPGKIIRIFIDQILLSYFNVKIPD